MKRIKRLFDGLPYFQPWVWELIAAFWIAGFLVGLAAGIWAYFSLA